MRPLILPLSLLPACLLRPVPDDSTSTTGDPSSSTTSTTDDPLPTSSTPTTTGTPDPSTTSTDDTTSSVDFIFKLDGPPLRPVQCEGLKQLNPECRPGQKCTIDGALNASHCVDIVDDPKGLYEPCTMQGDAWSGLDDCGLGLLCWNVDDEGHGICIGLADGTPDAPACIDPNATLSICQDCVFGYCFPPCDPLLQDCLDGAVCIPVSSSSTGGFTCQLDASGDEGQTNDPCEFVNACDPGLMCLNTGSASSACMQNVIGCCQPFCDFSKNAPCPNPDQKCLQYFDPMMEIPEGLEDVGICAIPP